MDYLLYYFLIINIVNFIIFALDKQKAKKHKWRVPEAWLFFISFIGGSLGGLLSMKIMRHKTNKASFYLGLPILLILNMLFYYYAIQFF